ncbi:hypothetical protein BKA70DRAFT_1338183 [Coprinopsis sp. MPI-PUGE-AT-0042]|nr:hypothetical protein BKA70DRAFT_1338183 [Coprinopsis sp. MPI-PUGE-AT-0042]
MKIHEPNHVLNEMECQLEVVYLVGIWLEALLYGVYLCLFIAAIPTFVRPDVLKALSTKVFLAGNALMFITISIHNVSSVVHLVMAFAYQTDVRGSVKLFNDLTLWGTYSAPTLLAIIVWIGDALVIYRCFLVWQRSYRVIVLPVLLFIVGVGSHSANLWWIQHQADVSHVVVGAWPFLNVPFPIYLAQNVLTTGLIVFKIWAQYQRSRAVGLMSLHTPSLVSIMRVIVESAAIYTGGTLVMVILRALDHPARFTIHCCLVPTTGIVFVLFAIRTQAVRDEAKNIPASASIMPDWLVKGWDCELKTASEEEPPPQSDLPSSPIGDNSSLVSNSNLVSRCIGAIETPTRSAS